MKFLLAPHVCPRSKIGMGAATKTTRASRRVTGQNVYQQSRMKGIGLKIGSDQYKEYHRKVCNEWSLMTSEERQLYEQKALVQTKLRKKAGTKMLSEDSGTAAPVVASSGETLPLSLIKFMFPCVHAALHNLAAVIKIYYTRNFLEVGQVRILNSH